MNDLQETEEQFFVYLLNSLLEYQQNPQIIYPIFQANLDKLTVDFAQRLRALEPQIRDSSPEESHTLAIVLLWLSNLILEFPLGDKTANIAIAKTGYECALIFYTRERNPLAWAEITVNLGIAYEEDPQADPVQKWEEAINCYQKASQVFTRTTNPERWASIQDNLGNAYRNRLQGEAEINLQQAIQYHQKALEIFTPEKNPRLSGMSQHNLGSDYLALSRLNIANNEQYLESGIKHYEQALQTLKKEVYPDLWAMNQLSLGNAYSVRLRGNPYENYEKAQRHYENALSVYTPATNPYYCQQVKAGQARLNQLKTDSNRETPEESSFIVQVLKLTLASEGDPQKVFPFLDKNLHQLNQNFIDELVSFISDLEKEKSQINIYQAFMMGIYPFSSLMMTFPKGNREINLDIAIAGWEIVLPFFERSQNYNLPSDLSSLCGIIKLELGNAFYEKYENRWGELDVNVEEAIKYFEEGFATLNSNHTLDRELYGESRISCRVKLGISYFYRNQIKGDPGDIEKAIDTYKLVLNSGCQENTLQWVQMNLGNAYCLRQGDPLENLTAAIECYKNSLKVCKQDADRTKWADVHINMGQAYYRRGMLGHPKSADDIELAIECNKNALKVYNDENKYPLRWAGLQSALGVCYSDRQMENRADNLELSINYLEQALRVRTKEKYPYDWAITLKTLGIVYHQRKRGNRLANLRQGIEYLKQALEVFTLEKYAVDWAETQGSLGSLYKNLAISLQHNAEYYQKAIACLEKTQRVFKPETNPKRWAKTQFELGTCYKNLGVFAKENPEENLAKAIECYRNALPYTSRESNPFGWAEITNSLGNAYQHKGQDQDAIECFEDTLKLHTREAFPTDYMKTLFNLGNTHAKFNKLTEAFKTYKEAIDTLEDDLIDQLVADDDAKRKFGEEWYQLYSAMVAVCLKLGKQNREYYATAWEYVERSKARRLVELFGQTKPDDVSDDVWTYFQRLRNDITNTEKWIEDKEKSIILSGEILSQHPELEPKKADLTELKKQLDQKLNDYPRLAATQRVQYTPFSKIGEKLSDDHTVIIQWYLLEADQKFCAFIYTRQSSQPYVWESSLEDLENLQQWHQEYFVNYISDFSAWSNKLSKRLERLSEILHIDELLNYRPPKCQQVILIPHRYLHLLPIHALPIKTETWQKFNPNSAPNQENYLFECFTKGVCYVPSCQTLLMLEKRSRPNFNQLFAMGNPTQDRAFTELCVKTVETFWKQNKPQSETKVLCGQEATKDALINKLKDYLKNAHTFLYSGHGSFEFDSPLDSGLILRDQPLQLTEIFGLNLEQCRLVTLIGCETGMTDWTSITDEYIGLPSAFLWAGVSGIVSSLWTVEEKASVFLGIKLYQNLLAQTEGEKNVIQALREAQKWLRNVTKSELWDWIEAQDLPLADVEEGLEQFLQQFNDRDKPFSSPYYWAAFCVIGK
ncbi:CHAT domain-containing protein [Microcoleus sp.]|uniref:CHAT domain-containing protein n=1 Tax=Microcoleus sp. TaxID=44472 RepID=UPI003523AC52